MTETKLSFVNGKWIEDPNSSFQLDNYMLRNLDKVKEIIKKNFDAVLIFDGPERAGKSTFAMMCGRYLADKDLTMDNFAKGIQDAAKKIQDLPDGSILVVDEASMVFNSRNSSSKEVKALLQLMDVVGQKRMVFILCLPSFFDLAPQIAMRRSKFLVRVSVDQDYNRGTILFWGETEKDRLYRKGKKEQNNYLAYPYNWVGHFTPWYHSWWSQYEEIIKKDSLRQALEYATGEKTRRNQEEIIQFVYHTLNYLMKQGKTYQEISDITGVSVGQINVWKQRYRKELGIEMDKQ